MTTVRLILSLASIHSWFLKQLDVNNAFRHGNLLEDVYMKLPLSLSSTQPGQVCKLQKSLYGLKQASRQWFAKLSTFLIALGYTQSKSDYSLFVQTTASSFTALLVYVDDVILTGNDNSEINAIKSVLDSTFKIKDLGNLKFFLGLEVARNKDGIVVNQCKYNLELIIDAGLLACKPVNSPVDNKVRLHKEDATPFEDVHEYKRLIGRLLYLTTTRPDITFAVQHLSQFLAKPSISHHAAALRILRYLKEFPALDSISLPIPQSSTRPIVIVTGPLALTLEGL